MAVVYFTSNASTGAGSLVEAVKNAQPGDVVRPTKPSSNAVRPSKSFSRRRLPSLKT